MFSDETFSFLSQYLSLSPLYSLLVCNDLSYLTASQPAKKNFTQVTRETEREREYRIRNRSRSWNKSKILVQKKPKTREKSLSTIGPNERTNGKRIWWTRWSGCQQNSYLSLSLARSLAHITTLESRIKNIHHHG